MFHVIVGVSCRLYSCLANGSADEFQKGDHLYRARTVKDVLQIGRSSLSYHVKSYR